MASIVVAGDTSGTVTLAAPAVSGTTTLTLPTTSGTVLTSASNTGFPTGSILQVVQGTYATFTSSSSSSYADTGLSATITPSSSANKILVFSTILGTGKNTGNTKIGLQLLRGATAISVFSTETGRSADYGASAQVDVGTISAINLDSPATTSATTYKIQLASVSNVAQVFINNVNTSPFLGSTLTLVEVKG
jgi:hypothetical protein